uniref:Chorismate lyase n=1 Tax=Vertebrata thuyoides TaxID=2006970 RepID=A0A1Z1MAQ0_9FLOR|nr:hypothetical protein [Vertebrata thuyoides]ARW63056.1 hypothetical protein [Vertebrata thuyoides]
MILYNIKIKTICIISTKRINKLIKKPIKITALYDGSHTKLIQYKIGSIINVNSLERKEIYVKKKLRYVWLTSSLYTNITFARSLWNILNNKNIIKDLENNSPIGLSFIKNQIDISKKFHEIYYCYCKDFESILKLKKPIWGRKYTIINSNNYKVLIQEFFSPDII